MLYTLEFSVSRSWKERPGEARLALIKSHYFYHCVWFLSAYCGCANDTASDLVSAFKMSYVCINSALQYTVFYNSIPAMVDHIFRYICTKKLNNLWIKEYLVLEQLLFLKLFGRFWPQLVSQIPQQLPKIVLGLLTL